MAASFREFIEENYFDYIYNHVKTYILNYKSSIPFRLKRIDTVHYVELEDAYFKKFYVHDYLNDQIRIILQFMKNIKEITLQK